ncbi:MAG: hypothetical protein LC722_00900 [Actinobacteria bacterium]|nr:hypothetical protein [Actinomycetota bacterium]
MATPLRLGGPQHSGPVADEPPAAPPPLAGTDRLARNLVLLSLVAVVIVRLFTEVVSVLPRFMQFIDVPVLAGLVLYLAISDRTERSRTRTPPWFGVPVLMFVALWAVSTVVNVSRVSPLPALLFLYGFVSPVLLFWIVYRIWPIGEALSLSRVFVALGVLQFAVVVFIDLPRFFAGGTNPDLISGTFGENAYQLVYFLLLFGALVSGIIMFEPGRAAARIGPALIGAAFLVIFLAQYRALLVTTALAVVFTGITIGTVRGRGALIAAASLAALFLTFFYVGSRFPLLRFDRAIQAIQQNPEALVAAKVGAGGDVMRMLSENPGFVVTGSGPGTYSSRAWRTFALLGTVGSHADVAGEYVQALTGPAGFRTDVSQRYIAPRLITTGILGSYALALPFSSYLALLAETGVLGLITVISVYVVSMTRSRRMAVATMRVALPGDPLPALLLAASVGFFALLQMAVLENWLEVTRVTFPTFILLGVGVKEYRGRSEAPSVA